ncbi:MAG: cupin domain-containing protein [Candidatus Bathyarchaeia archaeon]
MPIKVFKIEEIEAQWILGGPIKRIVNAQTSGAQHLNFSIGIFDPGQGLRTHIHPISEEVYFVLEGRGTVFIGEERNEVAIETGMAIYIPPGTIHGVKNTGSERLTIAFFVAPGREPSREV